MSSAFRAVKGDDGILAYTGSTFPIAKGKYREYNKIFYRSKQVVTGGTFNAAFWDVIGVTSGSSVSIGLVTTGGLTGTTSAGPNLNIGLGNSGVAANTYFYPQLTVDIKGRITSATSRTALSGFTGTAGITGATSGAGSGKILQVGLGNTAVTPGTYQKATITVDQKGRITFASGNTLTGANGVGVTGNTIGLNSTAVVAGTYQRATITVDSRGRITFASGNTAGSGSTTPVGVNGSIQFKQGSAFSGTSLFVYQNVSRALTIGTRSAGVTGTTSLTIGTSNVAQNTSSVAIGTSNVSSGIVSFVVGQSNGTASNYATLFGSGNTVNTGNDYAFVAGRSNSFNASSTSSAAFGLGNIVQSSYSFVTGFKNQVLGLGSFAGGLNESAGGNRPNYAAGKSSFVYSYTDTSQSLNHGAVGNFSAILGGRNNHIASINTGTTIIGGDTVKVTNAGYSYHAVVSNLAIDSTPSAGAITDDVTVWNSTSKKILKVTQDSISPQYNGIAWVSSSGSDVTGAIRIAKKPFLTIQAAVNALVGGASPASNNRCLVMVMPGNYAETVTLSTYVDICLNNAYVQTFVNNGSTAVDVKIFGKGGVVTNLLFANTNTSSRLDVDIDEVQGGYVRNGSINVAKLTTNNFGLIGSTQTLRAREINHSGSAMLYVQGSGNTIVDVDYHYCSSSGFGIGALQLGVISGKGKIVYNSRLTIAPNAPCIMFNINGPNCSADTITINGNFYSSYFDGVVTHTNPAGSAKLGGKIELSGTYRSTYTGGDAPAVKVVKDGFSTPVNWIFKNATLVAAGAGNSIGNTFGVTVPARYYGSVFGNNAVAGNVSTVLGSITIDSNVI